MPDPQFIQLPFGPGLDKETGAMVVKPNTMQDLRNVYHHEGSLVVRDGTEKTNEFFDGEAGWSQSGHSVGTGDAATHILAGVAIRSEYAGIVVSWEDTTKRVAVWRVNALGEESVFIGFWPFRSNPDGTVNSINDFAWPTFDDAPPKVVLAEMYGQVFFAHDSREVVYRADTFVYNPWGFVEDTLRFGPLTADFIGELEVIRFRGVVRHLHYLFGWGWGNSGPEGIRPELLRVSLPGEPTSFDPQHYFIAGDRRDPVIACEPARQTLLVCKETETYQVIGYSRANFGIRPYDQLYGCLASRLITSVAGTVYIWSAEGPMAGGDVGPFEKLWLPLDLEGFEPATLVARTEFSEGWADYIDEVELVVYCFGRRVYVLSVRNPADPRWTYWELGKKAFCGFRLYGGEGVGGIPGGTATNLSFTYETEGCGVYPKYITTVDLTDQTDTDLLELWHRPLGPFWEANILNDPLSVDSDGDAEPDNWTTEVNAPTGPSYLRYWDGSSVAFRMALGNATDQTTTAHYLGLKWTTGAVVVGERYRFEADCYTPGPSETVYGNAPWQIEVQFYDVGDSPVGALQKRDVRAPAYQRFYFEATAPASATYALVGFKGYIKNAGDQIEGFFRNPVWREEDTEAGAWVTVSSPVLAGPEATLTLPPVTVAEPGMDYEVAARFINLGLQATPGYESSNPSDWPAGSRATAAIPMDAPDWMGFYGAPPDLAPGDYVEIGSNRYFRMNPGCDPNGGTGTFPLKYANRDLQVYENDSPLAFMHRGEPTWFRQLRFADQGNTYQYKMRYLGPDRDSPFGSTISLRAGPDVQIPVILTLSKVLLLYAYYMQLQLTSRIHPYQGVQIQDNFDTTGPGGLLPANTWRTAWFSQSTLSLVPGQTVDHLMPDGSAIIVGKKADNLTLSVRVREFYDAYPTAASNPEETFVPTDVSPWSDIKTVLID